MRCEPGETRTGPNTSVREFRDRRTYEQAGDTHATAVTWSKIADVHYQHGDYDTAIDLQQRRVSTAQQLRDDDLAANSLWSLAQIDLIRDAYDAAVPRLSEAFEILVRLGRLDGIAAVGGILGRLLLAFDQPAAIATIATAADAYQMLRDLEEARELRALSPRLWARAFPGAARETPTVLTSPPAISPLPRSTATGSESQEPAARNWAT